MVAARHGRCVPQQCLGAYRKYSAGLWLPKAEQIRTAGSKPSHGAGGARKSDCDDPLSMSEAASLELVIERAQIKDGHDVSTDSNRQSWPGAEGLTRSEESVLGGALLPDELEFICVSVMVSVPPVLHFRRFLNWVAGGAVSPCMSPPSSRGAPLLACQTRALNGDSSKPKPPSGDSQTSAP